MTVHDGLRTLIVVLVALIPALGSTTYLFASAHARGRLAIPPRFGRAAATSARILAWGPVAFLVGLGTLVVLAWIRHGSFPQPIETRWDAPFGDVRLSGGPRASSFEPAPTILLVMLFASGVSVVLMPGLFALARALRRPTAKRTRALFYSSWSLLVIMIFTDPLSLLRWAFGD
jgi:hypothetical protein